MKLTKQDHRTMRSAFRRNLKRLRLANGMTQKDLASKCGIQPAVVSHYETGFRFPTVDSLLQLTLVLGVFMEELLYCPTVE